ncbi:hypothetical protein D3C81_896280 [compost metagenome]
MLEGRAERFLAPFCLPVGFPRAALEGVEYLLLVSACRIQCLHQVGNVAVVERLLEVRRRRVVFDHDVGVAQAQGQVVVQCPQQELLKRHKATFGTERRDFFVGIGEAGLRQWNTLLACAVGDVQGDFGQRRQVE